MIVHRTALLPLPAEHLYDIIEAAEHYPRFLPWCAAAHIVHRDDNVVSADLHVRWGGMSFDMRTRNPKRRPEYMAIHLERGPFKRFEGEWQLTVLAPDACKVAFNLDYEFDSSLMTRVAGPVFRRLTDTLVEAFIQHALATPVASAPVLAPTAAPPVVAAPVAQAAPAEVSTATLDTPAPPAPPAAEAAPEGSAAAVAGEAATASTVASPPAASSTEPLRDAAP
jgi:ribosome-associated toxin RatA of RatAB toxin-antitoxin module